MKKSNKKLLLFTGIGVFILAVLVIWVIKMTADNNIGASEPVMGANFDNGQWQIINAFGGFKTKPDASKLAETETPNAQNVITNDGDRISIRDFGYTVIGTATDTAVGMKSLHTFKKRSGENILMATWDTNVAYYEEGNDTWETLLTTTTADKKFGFADYNINTDLRSYTYFGNAEDPAMRWNGAHGTLAAAVVAGTTTIWVGTDEAVDFFATGTLRYCDNNVVYTAHTNDAFTVASAPVDCAADKGVMQAVSEYPTYPRGNIYMVANNRIFVAGNTTTPQAIYFSKYGDATSWSTSLVQESTADAAGIFNLGEGGGAVTGMVQDEGALYFFKKSIIYKATLSDSLYTLQALKPFDGRSQTVGAETNQSVFTGGNGVYFITPEKDFMSLQRVAQVDYPQIIPISDPISPTTDEGVYDEVTGISWKDYSYFAYKTNSDSASNDAVLLYNEDAGYWESPVVGWNVADFAVYDDGNGAELFFADALQPNVYKVTDGATDNALGVTANWRSKRYDFGSPQMLKEMDNFYVEGYISDNTTINITLMIDEDGYTQSYTTAFVGTESDYVLNVTPINMFGLSPFGYKRFGTSDETGLKKFRVYLNKDVRILPFYNVQVEFASDGEAQEWEVTNFGMRVRPSTQPEKRSLYRSFK